jgi:hypothetical protein
MKELLRIGIIRYLGEVRSSTIEETFTELRRLTPALSDLSEDHMAAQGSLTGADRLFN